MGRDQTTLFTWQVEARQRDRHPFTGACADCGCSVPRPLLICFGCLEIRQRGGAEAKEVLLTGEAHARKEDPPESKAWADRTRGDKASGIDYRLLEILRDQGGMTTIELADASGMTRVQVSPRMAPLMRLGLVERTGEKRQKCAVFGLKEPE